MAVHNSNHQENFRETGKFKPIHDQLHYHTTFDHFNNFQIVSLQVVGISFSILSGVEDVEYPKLWRLYFEDNLVTMDQEIIVKTLQNVFVHLTRTQQLQQNRNGEIFMNVCNILVERLTTPSSSFITSSLDYNSMLVIQDARQNLEGQWFHFLDCFQVQIQIPNADKQFREQVYIHTKEGYNKYHLVKKKQTLYMVKDLVQQSPILEINDQNLEQSIAEIENSSLVIENLSSRIIPIRFAAQKNHNKIAEPLRVVFDNLQLYQSILFKINRVKYQKYKVEETEAKQRHSFDKTQVDSKKESKTTPQKSKNNRFPMPSPALHKFNNKSTNNLEGAIDSNKKANKVAMMNNQKNMKISQRVVKNPKQSNLVPSQLDYPVSVKDEKQKQSGYFDQFENLLYDEETQQKQLTLNDSFQEFEKKQHSVKQQEIINELNKRKAKQNEQKIMLDSLKQKIKHLIVEQKEWISKNFKLKIEIKRIKSEGKNESNRQLEEIKQKIGELKKYQKVLIHELNQFKSHNTLEGIAFGTNSTPQSSHRAENEHKKITQSYNPFSSSNFALQLNASTKSNNCPVSPVKTLHSFVSPSASKSNNTNLQFNFRENQPKQQYNHQNKGLSNNTLTSPPVGTLHSSLRTQAMIQNNTGSFNHQTQFNLTGSTSGSQANAINNDYCLPGRSIPPEGFVGQLSFSNKNSMQNNKRYQPLNSNLKNL